MNTQANKNLLASLREYPLRWRIVRNGMQWTATGLWVVAGGFFLALLSFALRDASGVFSAILSILGGLALITGSLLAILGFVQCLLVPNAAPRILFLSGFLVAGYSVYLLISRMFYGFGGRRNSRFPEVGDLLEASQMAQVPGLFLSLLANLLIIAGFLALAADIGSWKTVKRIRIYWVVQFGGLLLLVGLAVFAEPISSAFGRIYAAILMPLLIAGFLLGYNMLILFMQSSILLGVRAELAQLAFRAENDDDEDEWISV